MVLRGIVRRHAPALQQAWCCPIPSSQLFNGSHTTAAPAHQGTSNRKRWQHDVLPGCLADCSTDLPQTCEGRLGPQPATSQCLGALQADGRAGQQVHGGRMAPRSCWQPECHSQIAKHVATTKTHDDPSPPSTHTPTCKLILVVAGGEGLVAPAVSHRSDGRRTGGTALCRCSRRCVAGH